ncbi:MAG: HlyD family secretion protein [Cryomorphaceae bacterium]|jgi:HlyD family secretion protein
MSSNDLHTLTRNNDSNFDSTSESSSNTTKRSYAWLLPVALLIGFVAIFILLFGNRFLPAAEVLATRVVTVRSGISSTKPTAKEKSDPAKQNPPTKGAMLFQASGWVEPDPYTIYVPSLTDGVVKNVHILEGQKVKQGDLLAELIDDDAKLILSSATQKHASLQKRITAHCIGLEITDTEIVLAKRQIETAEIRTAKAQDALDRFNNLSKGSVSEQQKFQAQLQLLEQKSETEERRSEIPRLEAKKLQIEAERESMDAALMELQTQIDTATLALERTRISSPINGIVLHLHAAPGKKRILKMDDPDSAVIVELYNPEKLQARIDIPLNEAASMRLQQIVELKSDLLPDRTFTGRVTRINGQADLVRNTLQAKVEIDNPDPRLRPDMLVRAKFYATGNDDGASSNISQTSSQKTGRLSIFVPDKAIFDKQYVWVISTENKAELRKLTLGTEIKSGHQQALDGVKSGEQVILPPFNNFKDDSRVRVAKTNLN